MTWKTLDFFLVGSVPAEEHLDKNVLEEEGEEEPDESTLEVEEHLDKDALLEEFSAGDVPSEDHFAGEVLFLKMSLIG